MALMGEHIFKQTLTDRAYIDTRAAGNAFGSDRPAISYTEGATEIPCRLTYLRANDLTGDSKAKIATCAIYLLKENEPATDDRIRITRRAGSTIASPVSYGVLRIENYPYGVKAECIEIKGGSVK